MLIPDAVMLCHIADAMSKIDAENANEPEDALKGMASNAKLLGLDSGDLFDVLAEIPAEMERSSMFIKR